ncbi:toxin-activating lysine-acyltransferase [Sphingobium sp. 3R8]|uniref:toxin-activating lysine-acyltransferase n=1 Tax=Sphingobium sp. 3R8 TaxID=2874921 RepID=UPI001CC9B9EE|nr:toxin-activating lysine-acyltransferase [Sphingobium sp. 3R8]MBZ9648145.1 toxin-activating lysine-acyltransferase [Sphingobium sp. 3R8]
MTDSTQNVTVSHMLGEVVWLMSQSPEYSDRALTSIVGHVLPPIVANQVIIFRDGSNVIGAVIWARVSDDVDRQITTPTEGQKKLLTIKEWSSGQIHWIMDMVFPFASDENNQINLAFADLVTGRFKSTPLKMIKTDRSNDVAEVVCLTESFGDDLVEALKKRLESKA